MNLKSWTKFAPFALFLATSVPACAHHGKDFLLLETDDMPLAGHVYALASLDTNIDKAGARSSEITPALLFSVGKNLTLEPHFHLHQEPGASFRFESTALDVRYRLGNLPGSQWRAAVSLGLEKPRDREENTNAEVRAIFVRTFPSSLLAVNLIAGHELSSGANYDFAVGAGIVRPQENGDAISLETVVRLPLRDGFEIVPGYSKKLGQTASFKIGVGLFHSEATTRGTLHLQVINRF